VSNQYDGDAIAKMRDSLIRLRTDMIFENPTKAYGVIKDMFADGHIGYNDMFGEEIIDEYELWFGERNNPYFPELNELMKKSDSDKNTAPVQFQDNSQ